MFKKLIVTGYPEVKRNPRVWSMPYYNVMVEEDASYVVLQYTVSTHNSLVICLLRILEASTSGEGNLKKY